MIYILYFTFWLNTGELAHSSYEAHVNYKVVTSKLACDKLAKEAEERFRLSPSFGEFYTKVKVECKRVNKSEYFSKRIHSYKESNEVGHEVYQKRKRKSRPRKKP